LGVRAHRVAFHLKYNSFSARLNSFRGWNNESQKPEDLATAGFFFTGGNFYLIDLVKLILVT